jgi:hypothetical protein
MQITDSGGDFDFKDLSYDYNKGTIYFVLVVPEQGYFFPSISMVLSNENNPEEYILYFLYFKFSIVNNEFINHNNLIINILI